VILLTIFWKKLFPPGKPPEDTLDGARPFQGLHFERNEAQESPAVAGALAKEIAARFAPRQEQPFSILAREQDAA